MVTLLWPEQDYPFPTHSIKLLTWAGHLRGSRAHYFGGHSTGNVFVLLAAVKSYGPKNLFYDLSNPKESELR